jgi:hypothetical protein
VTKRVCEKSTQNVAQAISLSKFIHFFFFAYKSSPDIWSTVVILKKLFKVDNCPLGENSPNLVTLTASYGWTRWRICDVSSSLSRWKGSRKKLRQWTHFDCFSAWENNDNASQWHFAEFNLFWAFISCSDGLARASSLCSLGLAMFALKCCLLLFLVQNLSFCSQQSLRAIRHKSRLDKTCLCFANNSFLTYIKLSSDRLHTYVWTCT